MAPKKPVKYNFQKPLKKVTAKFRTVGLWINPRTSTESSGSMTREMLDALLAANGITYADRFYLQIRPNYWKSDPGHPDRFLEVLLVSSRNEFNKEQRIINGFVEKKTKKEQEEEKE